MLEALIPDDAFDTDEAFWRFILTRMVPVIGAGFGMICVAELFYAFGVLALFAVLGAAALIVGFMPSEPRSTHHVIANGLGIAEAVAALKVPRTITIDSGYGSAYYKEVMDAYRADNPIKREAQKQLNDAIADAGDTPDFFNPSVIACPYPEHGSGCEIMYDAQHNQVIHRYDGKVENMEVRPLNEMPIKRPVHKERIAIGPARTLYAQKPHADYRRRDRLLHVPFVP